MSDTNKVISIDRAILSSSIVVNKVSKPSVKIRPEELPGSTYRVKSPLTHHALYITINNIFDDESGKLVPFEIFINCKDITHFQWIVGLTRMISAIFRKGGDILFILDELSSVVDPGVTGGYFNKRGKYVPSLVAELSEILKFHFIKLGLLTDSTLDEAARNFLAEKQKDYIDKTHDEISTGGYPSNASVCSKCNYKAVIFSEGCYTCLHCGDSRCG